MRKIYKLSVLIALVLSAALIFSACGNPFTESGKVENGVAKTDAEYKALIDEWVKYIEFSGSDNAKSVSATEIADSTKGETIGRDTLGNFSIRTEDVETALDDSFNDKTISKTTEIKILSPELKTVLTLTSKDVMLGTSSVVDETKYSVLDHKVYSVSVVFGAMYQVSKTYYAEKEYGEDEIAPQEPEYERKTVYSYYDADGKAIKENCDRTATSKYADNYSSTGNRVITIGDTQYVLGRGGDILAEFEYGKVHNIPVFDENSMTPGRGSSITQIVGGDSYAYFEVGDYKYLVYEEVPRSMQVGEFTLFTVPGAKITVMDKNYNVTVDYTTDCYAVMGYAVLPGGNVYVCEYKSLSKDAPTFDIQLQNEKFDIVHTVLNVATGDSTVIEKNFVASNLYNETTKSINSFLNQVAVGTLENRGDFFENGRVKDGYVLAQIQEFENGVLSADSLFAVLDSDLNVVAKLPKIIPNQFGYASFDKTGNMLIAVRATGDKLVYYSANTSNGKISLISKDISAVKPIKNGFLLNGVVYSERGEKLRDLSSIFEYGKLVAVENGKIYYEDSGVLYVGSIYSEKYMDGEGGWYEFRTETFDNTEGYHPYSSYSAGQGYIAASEKVDENTYKTYKIYNYSGKVILECERYGDRVVETEDYRAYYSSEQYISTFTAVGDGVYYVTVTTKLTLDNYTLIDPDSIAPAGIITETTHYIIK